MFHTLVASGHPPRLSPPRLLVSAGLHGLVIAAAIGLTRQTLPVAAAPSVVAPIPFLVPETQPLAQPPVRDRTPGGPAVMPTWTPDDQIPDLGIRVPAPTLPRVTDLVGDLAARIGRPGLPEPTSNVAAGRDGDPSTATSVDDPVAIIEQPRVEYPAALADAGISGRVELEYVVDTLGRAEPGSVRALVSTRPEFEAAARATVLSSRFRSARLRGHLVRQVVRQTLSFRAEQ